jgi:signal transduction histidine kinase/ActR/RegA family two-component response regulator
VNVTSTNEPRLPAQRGPWLSRGWFGLSIRAKGLTVIVIPLACVIGITLANLGLQRTETQVRVVAVVDRNLGSAANQVLADLVNAETGVRGYAATKDLLFLAPTDVALRRTSADRAALRAAATTVADRGQQESIDATAASALSNLAEIRAATGAGTSAKALLPALVTQKATMDRLRGQVAALADRADSDRVKQGDRITSLENEIEVLDIAGLVLALLAGVAGVALFTSGIARRVAAAADNADRLGQGLALEPIEPSGDELGRLADSLVRAENLLATRALDLTTARDGALQATNAKNAFLSHTSHELRTPLNSICGFAQLLQLSDLGVDDRDGAERILAAGRQLLALIDELIDISRIESGNLNLSVEPVSVVSLVDEISGLFGPLAAERSIQIRHHFIDANLAVQADRQRLAQVLTNLMSNAVKYNRRGGTLSLSYVEDTGENVGIVVSDTGPGINADDLDRIFVPFERLNAAETGIEGTGIGLPLAKALTEAMGGHLAASSVPGQGSAFTVTLRRAAISAPVVPPRPSPMLRRSHTPDDAPVVNILYVEDNPDNVEVVSRFLRTRPNTRLRAVASGRAAIGDATRDVPDVILLDLHLIDMHGMDVLNELKTEPRTAAIPVIVLSADASPTVVRRLLTHGALAFLTKPIELTQLADLLDSLISQTPLRAEPQPNVPATST